MLWVEAAVALVLAVLLAWAAATLIRRTYRLFDARAEDRRPGGPASAPGGPSPVRRAGGTPPRPAPSRMPRRSGGTAR